MIGAGHQIVFQFNGTINNAGNVTVKDASNADVGNATLSFNNSEVVVTLTNVPDSKRVTITLMGVNGTANPTVAMGFLVGDVTNSRSVNAADIAAVKARVNQAVTNANFKYDINASGTISSADVSAVKARAGMVLP